MTASELAANLREWSSQYMKLVGVSFTPPDNYWEFLAARISESGSIAADPDVVTIRTGSGPRRVRIVGTHGPRLQFEWADGSRGMGIVEKENVVEGPGKVTEVLERLLRAGKVREG